MGGGGGKGNLAVDGMLVVGEARVCLAELLVRVCAASAAYHERKLKVTINSDDPGLFASGTLGAMLPAVAAEGRFSEDDLAQLMINAFEGAWLPRERRDAYVEEVRDYLAAWRRPRI